MIIDSHCHFDAEAFDNDRDAVLLRAEQQGVESLISPAITAQSWPRLKQLSQSLPNVHACYGLHPMFIEQHQTSHLSQLKQWIEKEKPVAVGEMGMDFYISDVGHDKQRQFFRAQLDIAVAAHLPVIIHARKCVEEVLKEIRQRPLIGAVLHSYSGSAEQARQLLNHNVYFGFGGPLTWPKSTRLRKVLEAIPLENILLESDAPDQTGAKHRGLRNEPSYLTEVLDTVAEIKGLNREAVAKATKNNTQRLFCL